MKKPIPLWLIGLAVWILAFAAISFFWLYHGSRKGLTGRIDWPGLALGAVGPAGLVVMIVQRIRAEPTPEERAAFWAIFHSPPGTIGAVVVTRNGAPEVIATVRSTEEYLKLAGSGQLPADHRVYLPNDII
ncbi:MAG TPA: hypothetical protein VFZ09_28560 [Archangium sp.]|uniref:hypothetical protein n=1 Tax=Archangium sp. TaxID=1872627 RepID=UPI002E360C14|nr:hypothetical protein [Archangium sp.]HEX5750217.1 hypothetical protein [Archangium sp.]